MRKQFATNKGNLTHSILTPWKALNEVRRMVVLPFIKIYFALNGIHWGRNWLVYGLPMIQKHRFSQICIGDGLQMRNWLSSNPLGANHRSILATWNNEAKIEIGNQVKMTGVTICAQERIFIGDYVRIGANCTLVDTDFHPIDPDYRQLHPKEASSKPVVIEDNVFIGMGVMILKGTHIGCDSVVGAGSVVAGEFPSRVVIAGNPAKIIRNI